ncbi:aldo/keto reductase [Novosphingobium rosa]|uniref:aldo/keto reductase n=1 Tax=Novosphingobium rosa TaxID=76978 RepID=UPI00082B8A15|nr:aldo/keto reductase [Novosphingobium rosa]
MALERRKLGASGLEVTTLGLGGTGLANMYNAIAEESAERLIRGAHRLGIGFFDTAPCYGVGLSEQRLGRVLPALPRGDFVLSSKVGYDLLPLAEGENVSSLFAGTPRLKTRFDFSYDATMRSIEGSLARLGVSRVNMVAIHDPDETAGADPAADPYAASHFAEAMEGAYRALDALRSQKVIGAVGVGMNQWQMLVDFAQAGDFDYFLCAGRYTLLQYDAAQTLLPLCAARGISLIIGGPYCSGILASGAVEGAMFGYAPATPDVLARVRKIEQICADFGISLRAAALHFPLRHSAVASVIPGARSLDELTENLAAHAEAVPEDFWQALADAKLIDLYAIA